MKAIQGILFEPVGCLAEFPAEPFHEIAAQCFGRKKKPSASGSRSYWHLLNLAEAADKTLDDFLDLERRAVTAANVYEDVIPALAELKAMGIKLYIASSLSSLAIAHFLETFSLGEFFATTWDRNRAGGIKETPLRRALAAASLQPEHTMYLTDTAEGLKVAKSVGVNAILMMNDPDEARRLAAHDPAGGIVSLLELPDFVRLVATVSRA